MNDPTKLPCEFDHNGECLICDCWPSDCAYKLTKLNTKFNTKQFPMLEKFDIKTFEIETRQHSPNGIVLVHYMTINNKRLEQRVFIGAPSSILGKKLGDKVAEEIRGYLENKYARGYKYTTVQCSICRYEQTHTYPNSGKLYCCSCGELLDSISLDCWKSEYE